ncbi:MAG: hypothetical protein LKE46_02140 [Clostridium sp.]|jgi:hypothetical protein|uniref:hypothetical protein n=1 Tax=Clostridium sp. TaxID=1506 RepID=UPI0025BDFA6E|nr:hypothetical protein [Clostridium sp.]MCH3963049.1 hypothetical protein [Clostridium sp.]MCI1716488.1 hypothetical protein [Clostridium sp.]MCI1800828.1 hypothetical protein [Clostridium sp.]MCI1814517.1 hypothetical protein [Clostridium sp.]MCI1871427.1 hypothetical protein [Clostridium sp.]
MYYFIDELKDKKILNKNDILILKKYIDEKYPDYTASGKAAILSNTIHHILDDKLGEFNISERNKIKFYTLKDTIFNNRDSIFMYDIFNSCISAGNLNQNFIDELMHWLNSNVKNEVQKNSLKQYIKNRKGNKEHFSVTDSISKVDYNMNRIIPVSEVTSKSKNIRHYTTARWKKAATAAVIVFSMILYTVYVNGQVLPKSSPADDLTFPMYYIEKLYTYSNDKYPNANLPYYIKYRPIRTSKLKAFLANRNSILVKEPYFSTILNTAKEYNLNPILLFAITGQEQNFVPQSEKYASKIANNPFNVFHSWQEYNTNISDSSKIAARTIINLSKDMPKNTDPFLWIGRKYAEDKNWGQGVRSIFKEIEK